MKTYDRMNIYLPEHPKIARIIWPEQKRVYINTASDPDANIDYLMAPGQVFLTLSPTGKLPDGKPI